jgi:hypothetical protein
VRDEFNLSASAKLIAPSSPILLSVKSENEIPAIALLLRRLSDMRVEFDLSASDNLVAPSLPMLFTELSENELN